MDANVWTFEDAVPTGGRALRVGLVDLLAITALVAFGLTSHGTNPITAPLSALETALPFLLGWLAVSVFAGVYVVDALSSPAAAARVTAIGWIAAANVGLILRSSPLFDGGTAWPFTLVMTGFGLLVLLTWRVAYATLTGE